MQLIHIRLLVADFSECCRFYRDVLGPPLISAMRTIHMPAPRSVVLSLHWSS